MGRYDNYQEFRTLVSNLCSNRGFRFVEAFEHAPLMDKLVILSLVERNLRALATWIRVTIGLSIM